MNQSIYKKTGDFETLRTLMTDDAVVLPPGGRKISSKAEREAGSRVMEEYMQNVEVLEYILDFEEVKVLGDYAFEWGEIRGSERVKGGEVEYSSHKVMRILQKQPDGMWKVHRVIWNDNPK